jgi:hypothetical protein
MDEQYGDTQLEPRVDTSFASEVQDEEVSPTDNTKMVM